MAKIKYVGLKESRADTVAGTGKVWNGKGDVQEVPDIAVPRLLRHPDIWQLVTSEVSDPPPPPPPPPPPAPAPAPAPTAPVATAPTAPTTDTASTEDTSAGDSNQQSGSDQSGSGGEGDNAGQAAGAQAAFRMQTSAGVLELDALDRETLMTLAKAEGLNPHPQTGEVKLRTLLASKFPPKAE